MILSSPTISFWILRLCQENITSIALYKEENQQPIDLGQLLDVPGQIHQVFLWALETDEKRHRKPVCPKDKSDVGTCVTEKTCSSKLHYFKHRKS